MLNLSLMRHAKSDLNNFFHNDIDRPVLLKGVEETEKICEFIKKRILFDEVLCSPSRKTKETLNLIIKNSLDKPLVNYLDNLYYTSAIDIFDTVILDAAIKRVLVVSNQPFLSNSIDNFF